MSTPGPGWLDEPGHDEPVVLGQALAEWTAGHPHAKAQEDGEAGHRGVLDKDAATRPRWLLVRKAAKGRSPKRFEAVEGETA